jgi:proteic killer suppression protein
VDAGKLHGSRTLAFDTRQVGIGARVASARLVCGAGKRIASLAQPLDGDVSLIDTSGQGDPVAIQSFANESTEAVFHGRHPKGLPASILAVARRKLRQIHAAAALNDLKAPPGNRLHPLLRDRAGQHAIWINDQYRICFRWTETGPADVEIVDYH